MKKVLSVVLALCLTLLMCVPAFAADITQDTADSATVTVQTSDWEDAARFTVTIPATVTIPWGGTPAAVGADEFTWSYKTQLYAGDTLEVGIADADRTGSFAGADTLTYTLSGEMEAVAGDLAESTQTVAVDV